MKEKAKKTNVRVRKQQLLADEGLDGVVVLRQHALVGKTWTLHQPVPGEGCVNVCQSFPEEDVEEDGEEAKKTEGQARGTDGACLCVVSYASAAGGTQLADGSIKEDGRKVHVREAFLLLWVLVPVVKVSALHAEEVIILDLLHVALRASTHR